MRKNHQPSTPKQKTAENNLTLVDCVFISHCLDEFQLLAVGIMCRGVSHVKKIDRIEILELEP